jgi:hypothetical protein
MPFHPRTSQHPVQTRHLGFIAYIAETSLVVMLRLANHESFYDPCFRPQYPLLRVLGGLTSGSPQPRRDRRRSSKHCPWPTSLFVALVAIPFPRERIHHDTGVLRAQRTWPQDTRKPGPFNTFFRNPAAKGETTFCNVLVYRTSPSTRRPAYTRLARRDLGAVLRRLHWTRLCLCRSFNAQLGRIGHHIALNCNNCVCARRRILHESRRL